VVQVVSSVEIWIWYAFPYAAHAVVQPVLRPAVDPGRSRLGARAQPGQAARGRRGCGDRVALRSRANSQFVCAENGGAGALLANRATAGSWETFTLVRNSDGSESLRATVNGKYVTAENAGAQPLIANRDEIGPWEKFDLVEG
jgi:hypothetical protein